jgi:hypothetical protein
MAQATDDPTATQLRKPEGFKSKAQALTAGRMAKRMGRADLAWRGRGTISCRT